MAHNTEAAASTLHKFNLKNIRRSAAFLATVTAAAYGCKAFLTALSALPQWAIAAGTLGAISFLMISIFDN